MWLLVAQGPVTLHWKTKWEWVITTSQDGLCSPKQLGWGQCLLYTQACGLPWVHTRSQKVW